MALDSNRYTWTLEETDYKSPPCLFLRREGTAIAYIQQQPDGHYFTEYFCDDALNTDRVKNLDSIELAKAVMESIIHLSTTKVLK
jgi:hypothetical protein